MKDGHDQEQGDPANDPIMRITPEGASSILKVLSTATPYLCSSCRLSDLRDLMTTAHRLGSARQVESMTVAEARMLIVAITAALRGGSFKTPGEILEAISHIEAISTPLRNDLHGN